MYQPFSRLTRTACFGLLALALTGPAFAPATTVLPSNLGELTDNAGKIFVGTVASQEVVKVGDGWGERITAEVTEPVRGVAAGETVTWTQYRMGEQTRMSGMPEYEAGKSYLIFLNSPAPNSPYTAPVTLGQGVFSITTTKDGSVRARNQFNNAHVYAGLDMAKLAPDAAPKRAVSRLKNGATAGGQTELGSLLAQTRALDAAPKGQATKQYGRPAREAVPLGLPGSPAAGAAQLSARVK